MRGSAAEGAAFLPKEVQVPRLRSNSLLVLKYRAFAARGAFESIADLLRIEFQFCDRPAKRIAVHAQFPSRLALVSPVIDSTSRMKRRLNSRTASS